MGTSHRDSLSDDWEDLGEDDLSVISIPLSDDEVTLGGAEEQKPQVTDHKRLLAPKDGDSDCPKPASGDEFSRTPTSGNIDYSHQSTTKGKDKAVEGSPQLNSLANDSKPTKWSSLFPSDTATVSDKNSSSLYSSDTEADGPPDEAVRELVNSQNINADYILKTLQSLDGIFDEVLQAVQNDINIDSILSKIAFIYELRSQVSDLKPIVSGYARVWHGTSQELPLDPGLNEWLSGVRVNMFRLLHELQLINNAESDGVSGQRHALVKVWEDLEDYQKQMDAFLPIMQVDFNEFQTKRMNIPVLPVNSPARNDTARSAPIDIPQASNRASFQSNRLSRSRPTSDGWILRRELYNLKDEVQRAIDALSKAFSLPSSQKALANDIVKSYQEVSQTVSLILSNHSSDWIESSLAGGLSYAEFMELDPDCIRDLTFQLERTVNEIEPRYKDYPGFIPPENRVAGQSLYDDGRLDQFESIAQVLVATLKPNRG